MGEGFFQGPTKKASSHSSGGNEKKVRSTFKFNFEFRRSQLPTRSESNLNALLPPSLSQERTYHNYRVPRSRRPPREDRSSRRERRWHHSSFPWKWGSHPFGRLQGTRKEGNQG